MERTSQPSRITLDEWTHHYDRLRGAGLREASYGGPLCRHVSAGDSRLTHLSFDNSAAALRLWNLLLSEDERLHQARSAGKKIIGVMKDLGTAAVLAWSMPNVVAFYPDGAWWTPCIMEHNVRLLEIAASLGLGDAFCPVRAMVGAFVTGEHFPRPDLLICSAGAICDDFSVVAQRLESLGFPITWWEMPRRRRPDSNEAVVELPGGSTAPAQQLQQVESELRRVGQAIADACGHEMNDHILAAGIQQANKVRACLRQLRELVFNTDPCPLPALEMLIAEMLVIHCCSDHDECLAVLQDLLAEVRQRIDRNQGILPRDAVRIFWVNPVADLRIMNVIEDVGGRICGTDYMVLHAIDRIPEDVPPMQALARAALADVMVGPAQDRVDRICRDAARFGAEAVVISRIPGASHCATEGAVIRDGVRERLNLPSVEIEVMSITNAVEPSLRTRLQALIESVKERRR